jgi:hypothetical protein
MSIIPTLVELRQKNYELRPPWAAQQDSDLKIKDI